MAVERGSAGAAQPGGLQPRGDPEDIVGPERRRLVQSTSILVWRELEGDWHTKTYDWPEPSHFVIFSPIRSNETIDLERLQAAISKALAGDWVRVTAASLFVRSTPGNLTTSLGFVKQGDLLEVLEARTLSGWGYPWGRIGAIMRNGSLSSQAAAVPGLGQPGSRWVYLHYVEAV